MREKSEKKQRGAWYVVRKVLNVLGVLLILLLMALCAFLIYQRVTGQEPKLFGYRLFEVQSGSMEPTIMTKDTILTKEFKTGDRLDVGDIVVFLNDGIWNAVGRPELRGNYIVHRVKEIYEGEDGKTYIVTRGDHNNANDPATPIDAVVAKYVVKFGAFFSFIRSPFGIVAIVAVLVGLFASMRLIYALGERKKKRKADLAAAEKEASAIGTDGTTELDADAQMTGIRESKKKENLREKKRRSAEAGSDAPDPKKEIVRENSESGFTEYDAEADGAGTVEPDGEIETEKEVTDKKDDKAERQIGR